MTVNIVEISAGGAATHDAFVRAALLLALELGPQKVHELVERCEARAAADPSSRDGALWNAETAAALRWMVIT